MGQQGCSRTSTKLKNVWRSSRPAVRRSVNVLKAKLAYCIPDMELGPFYLVWDPSISGFRKKPKMQNVHLKCWNDKSHCQVSVVGLKSPDVSPCNELLLLPMIIKNSHTPTHKSTFGVHYRTRSPGQLGLRVAGFPGDWVTKCDPVPCLLYAHGTAAAACFDRARTCYRDVLCRRAVRCHLTVSVRLQSRGVHGNGEDWDPMGPMGFPWEWE